MSGADAMDMELLGREVAQSVAGPGVIDEVRVRHGATFDQEPTFDFYFRVDPDRLPARLGLMRLRLSQQLQDRLANAGEDRLAVVHMLDHRDWQHWTND